MPVHPTSPQPSIHPPSIHAPSIHPPSIHAPEMLRRVAAAHAALGSAARVSVEHLDAWELAESLTALAVLESDVGAQRQRLRAEADRRGLAEPDGHPGDALRHGP
ncbi:MAG: hypothetical protein ACXVXC_06515 [Nocardioidaceae bacterium]